MSYAKQTNNNGYNYELFDVLTLIKLQYYKLAMSYAKQTNHNGYNYELFEDRDFKFD
jgi:hypothetical protein